MKPVLKYPGAKWRVAKKIIEFVPEHQFYLEPFFGSGAVFFNKPPSKHETINDIDGMVVNFFEVCRDYPNELIERIQLTPFARDEFLSIQEKHAGDEISLTGNKIEDARRFAVRCWMGFGSKLSDRVGFKCNLKSNGPQNPQIWNKLPSVIGEAATRLKNATIENGDAIELILKHNYSDCLIYADPPYLFSSRKTTRLYRHEMGEIPQHEALLNVLKSHKGLVLLSGYDNELYNESLVGWYKVQFQSTNARSLACTETLWMNFAPNSLFI